MAHVKQGDSGSTRANIHEHANFHFAGALHTHKSLRTQIQGLCEAWAWQKNDRILHALPLHHVHGIINALYCAHYSGACVEFMPKISPDAVWDRLKVCACAILFKTESLFVHCILCPHQVDYLSMLCPSSTVFRNSALALPQRQEEAVTVYMGVPTMYSYLLAKYDQASEQDQQQAR